MALIEKYYFKSKDVKVFPSSFRGTYTNSLNEETTFDPEARLNSEFNFVNAKRTSNKTSYIVEYSGTVIKFVLGGYYFEISNLSDYLDELKEQHLGIKVRTIDLNTDERVDNQYSTPVLDTWVDTTNKVLDTSIEVDNKTTYYFTGLKVLEGTETLTHDSIQLFDAEGNINKKAFLVDLDHGDGETTLLHGEGLVASYENQTVFGTYNDNKEGTLFEVGNGTTELDEEGNLTAENRSNALEIKSDETNIKTDLNIIPNNINARVVVTNTETTLSSIGEINLETTKVNIEGSETLTTTAPTTTINAGTSTIIKTPTLDIQNNNSGSKVKIEDTKVTINLPTDLNNTLTVADEKKTTLGGTLEVKGTTTLNNTLTVNNTTQLNNSLTVAAGKNTALGGTLEVDGATTLNNNLTVASEKKTTLGGQLEVNGTVDINAQTTITGAVNINTDNQSSPGAVTIYGDTTINSNLTVADGKTTTLGGTLEVDGTTQLNNNLTVASGKNTTLGGDLTVAGKATSASTVDTDGDTTLTTKGYLKGYIDTKITELDVASVGEDGKYLKTIEEEDGKIKTTIQSFDKSFDSATDNNAPTTLAVKTHVTTEIGKLNVGQIGGAGKYITSISEANGRITAIAQSIDTEISSGSSTNNIPSSNAVWNAIDDKFKYSIRPIDEQANYFFYWNTLTVESPGIVKSGLGGWETFNIADLIKDGHSYTIEQIVSSLSVGYGTSIGDRLNGKEDGEQAEQMGRWGNAYYVDISSDKKTLYILNVNPWDTISVKVLLLLKRVY